MTQTAETRAKLAAYTGDRGSAYKHGWARTPTYRSWNSMKSRCRDVSNYSYARSGGRGIKVCERWSDFLNFLEDMGERPSLNHSIDRIDNDGDYEPGNCRWLSRAEQNARRADPGGWVTRRANQQHTPPRVAEIKHGTYGGYQACRKRPEKACPPCRAASNAYAKERRQARRDN